MTKEIMSTPQRKFRIMEASVDGVYERWKEQYKDGRNATTAKLKEFGPNGDPNEVAAIIGNKTWTHAQCLSCGEYTLRVIEFFDGYEGTASICKECLEAGLSAFNSVT